MVDISRLSDIKINDTGITGFDKSVTQYNVEIAEGITEVPQVTAMASNPNATVEIRQVASLDGTEEERTAEIIVTATDGISKTVYRVTFSEKAVVPETDDNSRLASIKVNGKDIAGFSESVTQYNVEITKGTTKVLQVTATASNLNATVEIKQAVSLDGTEEERTAEVTVTATDGVSKTIYIVTFDIKVPTSENNDKTNAGKITNNSTNDAQLSTEESSQTVLATSPETSDSIHIMHWVIILIISLIALSIGLKRWKKSEYFDE